MIQRKKNIQLLLLLLLLIAAVSATPFVLQKSSSNVVIDKDMFKVEDISVVDKIEIEGGGVATMLVFDNGKWRVNDKFDADPQRIDVLFSIIGKVEAQRPATLEENKQIVKGSVPLKTVRVFAGDVLVQSFKVVGNQSNTLSYFEQDGQYYVTHIPGYAAYIAGYFDLQEKDWRNSFVFANAWSTLQKMAVGFTQRPSDGFTIEHGLNNYYIDGIENLDTAKMYGLMERISFLQVAEYIEKNEFKQYDSLSKTQPPYQVVVEDLSGKKLTIEFFNRIGEDAFALGRIDSTQLALFGMKQIAPIVKVRRPGLILK